MKTIVLDDPIALKREWHDQLLGRVFDADKMADVFSSLDWMRNNAINIQKIGEETARWGIWEAYKDIRATLNTTVVGARPAWPEVFWTGPVGRFVYYAFYTTYGDDLLYQNEVAGLLGMTGRWSISQLGHLQRAGEIDYLIDADVPHPLQGKRRTPRPCVEEYLARKEAGHVTPPAGKP